MTSSSYIDALAALDACPPALDWLRESGHPDLASAWAVCPRGDWMLWLAGRTAGPPGSDSRRPLVLAACACARTALHLYEERFPGDIRPRRAIEAAEAWARGEATLDDVRVAARGARAAAAVAAAASAAASAFAAYADVRFLPLSQSCAHIAQAIGISSNCSAQRIANSTRFSVLISGNGISRISRCALHQDFSPSVPITGEHSVSHSFGLPMRA